MPPSGRKGTHRPFCHPEFVEGSVQFQRDGVREFHVYILSNAAQVLYIGMTADLDRRMEQHMEDRDPKSFVARYNLDRLVFLETYPTADQAITREKQLKGWSRSRKKKLIFEQNPTWSNLLYG